MVVIEIALYFIVLFVFLFFKRIKGFFGSEPRFNKSKGIHPYDLIDKSQKQKPIWLIKAHYGFLIFLYIFLFLGLTGLLTWLWSVLQKTFVFSDPDAIYFGSTWGITMLPVLFMSLALSNLILESLPFKTARYAGRKYYNVPSPHKTDIKLTLWVFIFFFAIGFPFVIFNTDYYSCVKNDTFHLSHFFSFSEETYNLSSDVDYVEITYSQDRDGDYSFYYNIFFNNKKKTEILNNSLLDSEKVVLINNILTKNQVKIDLEPINSSQWISIDRQYSDAVFSTLEQLYGVD